MMNFISKRNQMNFKFTRLLVIFVNILNYISETSSLDPCIFRGNCNIGTLLGDVGKVLNTNVAIGIGNNKNQNTRNDPGEEPVIVDGNWIESASLNTNQIYLFPQDAPSMTWYDAERYCEDKGAHLAEPFDEAEQNFLRDQANRLPNTNWWLGLREFEKCECVALGRLSSSSKIDAFVDKDSLFIQANNGLGLTTCPQNFKKVCNGNEWRWGFSGQKATYTYWNTKTGEPNGNSEHCVTMWFKSDNQRWGDWLCSSTEDSPNENTGFKPVCQKTKNTDGNAKDPDGDDYDCGEYDEYCDDDDEDQNANLEEGPAKCVAPDTSYKFGGKKNVVEKIKGVGSFQECQRKCADESECKYWKFKKNGKCILSRNIKRNGFIKEKEGVYSGTILNGCNPNTNTEDENTEETTDTSNDSEKDYCIEYGATYNGGTTIRQLNNVENAELCRQECLKANGCSYYNYSGKVNKRGRKKKKCVLKSANSKEELDVARKRYSFAGSVEGKCRSIELSDNDVCHCEKIGRKKSSNSNTRTVTANSRSNPNDEVEEFPVGKDGSVDQEAFFDENWTIADILGQGVDRNDDTNCRKQQVKRCKSSVDTNEELNQQYERGEYCVDYNVKYEDGGEFKVVENVESQHECRFECLTTQSSDGCRFYSWSKEERKCYLMKDELWIPAIEQGAVSGTLDGLCKTQSFGQLGECECQKVEVYDEYYDELDLVSTGLIDVRSGQSTGCPEDQGKRCFARVPIKQSFPSSDSRSLIRGLLPKNENSAVIFG